MCSMRRTLLLVLSVGAAACDGGRGADAGAFDDGGSDARVGPGDAGTALPDAGPASVLPIAEDAITPVGVGPGLDVYAELHGDALVFEHYDDAFTMGELRRVDLSDLAAPPVTLDLGLSEAMVGNPSLPIRGGVPTLYLVATESSSASARVERRPWSGAAPGAAEGVTMPEPIGLLSWPRFVALADGRVAVAYRDGASLVKLAFSDDGLAFDAPQVMGPAGAQPELAQMASGALVYAYQVGVGGDIQSWYRVSTDGSAWSDAALVTDSSTNVHDTDAFVRADGRVDLYYIWPDSALGFDLWRRCVSADGALGPEELVVVRSWGNLAKPRAHRRADGAIQLTFVDQNRGHRLFTARLVGDAPCD